MVSVIFLSLLIVVSIVALVYLFNESKVQPDSPTIAAMEAHTEALEARRRAEMEYEYRSDPSEGPENIEGFGPPDTEGRDFAAAPAELPPIAPVSDYEYRAMLDEGGGNYALPPWIGNFFSSSDICHTLDRSDDVVLIVRMSDPASVDSGMVEFSLDSDMTTQTVTLKLCLGRGAAAETFRTKFYLFERGDLFELGRLARQSDARIDILTRAPDYTLEYVRTTRAALPRQLLAQLGRVLANTPT
jgi:hypothetical protein